MTRVRTSFAVLRMEDETLDFDESPDDIGDAEVLEALQVLYPFDDIERDSLWWEVVSDD